MTFAGIVDAMAAVPGKPTERPTDGRVGGHANPCPKASLLVAAAFASQRTIVGSGDPCLIDVHGWKHKVRHRQSGKLSVIHIDFPIKVFMGGSDFNVSEHPEAAEGALNRTSECFEPFLTQGLSAAVQNWLALSTQ